MTATATRSTPTSRSHASTRGLRRVLLLTAAATVLALAPYLAGLIGALVLVAATAPLHRRLARRLPRRLAALLIVLGVLLLGLVPGAWLATTAFAEARDALSRLQHSNLLGRLSQLRLGDFDVAQAVASLGSTLLAWTSGQALSLVGTATEATLNVALALFGLYYLLVEGDALWRRTKRIARIPDDMIELLRARFVSVTDAMVIGTLLTAIVQGIVVGGSFWLVGLRAPVLWGVVTACVSVLPMFGSALVWLPGVIVLALAHRYGAALLLGVLGVGLASNLDNVVRLVVYKRVSGIHPMLTLIGAFAGVRLFGLAGVLIGPLALSYFVALLDAYEHHVAQTSSEHTA